VLGPAPVLFKTPVGLNPRQMETSPADSSFLWSWVDLAESPCLEAHHDGSEISQVSSVLQSAGVERRNSVDVLGECSDISVETVVIGFRARNTLHLATPFSLPVTIISFFVSIVL
jgi:hypothetical protein